MRLGIALSAAALALSMTFGTAVPALAGTANHAVTTAQVSHYPRSRIHGHLRRERALRWALTRQGDPYVWGAAGPHAFDCSGLAMWAYRHAGITLAHFTGDQWHEGRHVSVRHLKPGDLVFFYPGVEHVGLYVGHGLMVDAPHTGASVRVEPVFWDEYDGAVRVSR